MLNVDDFESLETEGDKVMKSIPKKDIAGATNKQGTSVSERPKKATRRGASSKLYDGFLIIIVLSGCLLYTLTWSDRKMETLSAPTTYSADPNHYPNHHHHHHGHQVQKEKLLNDFILKNSNEQKKQTDPKNKRTAAYEGENKIPENHPDYHVVFSTSCIDQQHWESYVFFYHAWKVGQPGNVTRIVSGCTEEDGKELQDFHEKHIRTMSPNFHMHLTPDFGSLTKTQGLGDERNYKYMNKPFGLRHWIEATFPMNEKGRVSIDVEDSIVFLLDPDMILLRPIVHDFTQQDVKYAGAGEQDIKTRVVRHGFPICQQDGYLGNQWMTLNITHVVGEKSKGILHLRGSDGRLHYNSGPPYISTLRDTYNIAVLWTEYAPRVYDIHPKLFAEMYGYIIATTQLDLIPTLIKSLVVSTTTTETREGWPYIDAIPDEEICSPSPESRLPVGIHYCKRYLLDTWFFSKYRLKKKYISCETPLLASPPLDLALKKYNYSLQPPPHGHVGEWTPPVTIVQSHHAKREAYMICALISKINEAAIHYKKTACNNGTANFSTNYTFFNDPHH